MVDRIRKEKNGTDFKSEIARNIKNSRGLVMCGICGKSIVGKLPESAEMLIYKMMNTLKHRGPDDEGFYMSEGVVIGHRRLSIIDLNTGKQPISNEDKTVWVVFNGEIYNFASVKDDLSKIGHVFRTKTDTEILVHGYEQYGTELLSKLRGMFAFAIWDQRKKMLFIARDRAGIKPLYYAITKNGITFASEIKAILQDPDVNRQINLQCVDRFLSYNYCPGKETMFKNIFKMLPGNCLVWKDGNILEKEYWNIKYNVNRKICSVLETADDLMTRLKEAVRIHMISDVPVGFLLSGGVDSTALLSLAINETNKEISTFTVGFDDNNFADERKYARLAATFFGTRQYDLSISSKDFEEFLPKYVWHMEEPVCEPPAIALYYISKLASEHVKVLISGEGADEAFAGYPNYRNFVWLERLKNLLGSKKDIGAEAIIALSRIPGFERLKKFPPLMGLQLIDYYLSRTGSPFTLFNSKYQSVYSTEFRDKVNKVESYHPTSSLSKNGLDLDELNTMLYIDTKSWLPDDLLLKADKITMANSIELRVPFLDHNILEFAGTLPTSYKLHGVTTKFILKKAFKNIVPKKILDRKKTGFPVPYEKWLRSDLREIIEDTLLSQIATQRGYFQKNAIENLLEENRNHGNYPKEVFSLLILELWHRQFIDNLI